MFKDVPMKIVVPIIVVTWILSLVTTLTIVYMAPALFPVRREQISAGSVTSDSIEDGAIITVKLADGNVTSAKILNGTILAVDLADGSIITAKISNGTITTAKIADVAVTTPKIADNAIITAKLVDGSVTSAKIVNGTITAANLADGSIINVKVADGAVTTNKIADGAVTNSKLAPGAIPFSVAYSTSQDATNSIHPAFVDMPYMTASVTLQRPSNLWIMFSAFASEDATYYIRVRAYINDANVASPWDYILTAYSGMWISHACNFYYYASAASYPATFTVKIQWDVDGSTAHVWNRALAVMALPA